MRYIFPGHIARCLRVLRCHGEVPGKNEAAPGHGEVCLLCHIGSLQEGNDMGFVIRL